MLNLLRVFRMWVVTAWRAAPLLTVVLCLATASAAVAGPLAVYGVKLALDQLTSGEYIWAGVSVVALSLLITTVAAAAIGPLGDILDDRLQRFVYADLIRMTSEIPTIDHHEDPRLVDRLSLVERDSYQLAGIYQLLTSLASLASMWVALAMLWSVHPLTCLLAATALLPALADAVRTHRTDQLWLANYWYRRLGQRLTDVLTDASKALEVRTYSFRCSLGEIAAQAYDDHRKLMVALRRRFAYISAAAWVVFAASYVVAIWLTFSRARAGLNTFGDLSLMLLIGPQLAATAQGVATNATTILGALQAFGRYQWLRDYHDAQIPSTRAIEIPARLFSGIRLENVTFTYAGRRDRSASTPALRNLNLTLPAGSIVALVGENGAGKSTLVKLLAALYEPTSGTIYIDDVPLRDVNPDQWRQRVSAGFQDYATFEFVAADSVGVGDLARRADQDALEYAVRQSQSQQVMEHLPEGFRTQLGTQFKEGVGLSGGQWQRLALARGFMRREPLLMLLDEPTAALDPEAESALYDAQVRAARAQAHQTGAITLVVSHRFSTARMADLIVVLENASISEAGTHDELMESGGTYARLFELQAKAYRT
jgi:ATP-binding cassette subfamily B protein